MKPRRQRPIAGGRIRRSGGFEKELDRELRRAAVRFNVTVPMVITTALADYCGVELPIKDRAEVAKLKVLRRA